MIRKALLLSMLVAGRAAADDGSLRLNVNLSSYELEVWEGEEKIRSYTATIGTSEFPTPTGGFQITRIEWNPRWTPPPSPWARGKEEAPPGPNNPMGRVKMQFDHYLYVHGTSQVGRLGSAASHGCVRLSNADALDLARLLASRTGAISSAEIDRLEGSSRRTYSVWLPTPVPVRIRYGAGDEGGDDPYGWRETSRQPAAGVGLARTSKRWSVPIAEARA
jgi:murein L,D-transpeptidase YcbB/YkuD